MLRTLAGIGRHDRATSARPPEKEYGASGPVSTCCITNILLVGTGDFGWRFRSRKLLCFSALLRACQAQHEWVRVRRLAIAETHLDLALELWRLCCAVLGSEALASEIQLLKQVVAVQTEMRLGLSSQLEVQRSRLPHQQTWPLIHMHTRALRGERKSGDALAAGLKLMRCSCRQLRLRSRGPRSWQPAKAPQMNSAWRGRRGLRRLLPAPQHFRVRL